MKPVFTNTIFAIIIIFTFSSCGNNNSDTDPNLPSVSIGIPPPQKLNFTIIGQRNHDTSAYTQGLIYYKGVMYEGTGDYENSSLRITDWKTGNVLNKHMMGSSEIFGEGITILNDTLFQLTWTNNIVYVYLLDNLDKPIKTFKWPYEGWGITTDGMNLLISDGSSNIYTVRPSDFKILNTIQIIDNDGPVNYLNELELINGFIYANVYQTNRIVKIDPESGHVVGEITLSNLLQSNEITTRTDVLNGIAFDSTTNTMFITGKRWPKLFELKLN